MRMNRPQQVGRLKRAAKQTPLVLSAATRQGVPEALRALLTVIDRSRSAETDQPAAAPLWRP